MARVFLGFVNPGEVKTLFMVSVLRLLATTSHTMTIRPEGSGPLISRARNKLFKEFLETDHDYFLSVDTDIDFEPGALDGLIARDLPIVGAHYTGILDGGKTFPVALRRDPETKRYDKLTYRSRDGVGGKTGVKQVAAVGFGFTLVRRDVLEALAPVRELWPCAEIEWEGQALGEDTTFCLRAEEVGFESWLDLETRVGHLKPQLFK